MPEEGYVEASKRRRDFVDTVIAPAPTLFGPHKA